MKELNNIRVSEFNTASAEGLADAFLMVGPMEVDVTIEGIYARALIEPGLQAPEAENTRSDEIPLIFLGFQFIKAMPHRFAPSENHAFRFSRSKFFRDRVESSRRSKTILLFRRGILGGGNREEAVHKIRLEKITPLLRNRHSDQRIGPTKGMAA